MVLGRRSLAAVQMIQDGRRWLRSHLLRQAWIADQFSRPDAHEESVLDTILCDTYREALRRTVRPGDIVLDLGASTGLLSFFAIQAGARHVYAVEMSTIAEVAAKLIKANGLEDRISLIRENSAKVTLPEAADVLVTDAFGSMCFDDEDIVRYVVDARRRLLKPGARIIPGVCRAYLTPFSSDQFGPGRLPPRLYGLDYQALRERRFASVYGVTVNSGSFACLGPHRRFAEVDFYNACSAPGATSVTFSASVDGRLDGFLGWFESELCDKVVLSNAPHLPTTCWRQLCFPVIEQPRVRPGDLILLTLDPAMIAGEAHWKYRVEVSSTRS